MTGYRAPDGRVIMTHRGAFHDKPIELPCRQCIGCRKEYTRQWSIRLMHEAQMHEATSFITLTYDDENLPPGHSLDVRHWQLFAKRLRKRCGKFRFFHCGEYGDRNGRPHYHALLFGIDFHFDRKQTKTHPHPVFESETLNKIWGKGRTDVGIVNSKTAAYVAGYIQKKINGERAEAHYERVDPDTGEVHNARPEYATMSRNPGIGASFLEKHADQIYPRDEVIVDGRAVQPPSYYDKKMYESQPELQEELRKKRLTGVARYEHNNTPERRAVREKKAQLDRRMFLREPEP